MNVQQYYYFIIALVGVHFGGLHVPGRRRSVKNDRLSTGKTRSFQINFSTIGRRHRCMQGLPSASKAVFRRDDFVSIVAAAAV